MVHFSSKHVLENLQMYYQGNSNITKSEMKTKKKEKVLQIITMFMIDTVSNYL